LNESYDNNQIVLNAFSLAILPTSGACVELSRGHKPINGNAHRSYQVLLFLMFMGQPL